MRVEIIILKYKSPDLETRCLQSIIENTDEEYQLTVYDSRREDANMSRMWNKLIKESKCGYLCIMDSDCEVDKGWITEMLDCFNDKVACVVATTENIGTPSQMLPGRIELEMATGNCMMFKRCIFDEVGYFDEDFGVFGQDSEWFRRVVKKGFKIIKADTFIKHVGNGSTKKAADDGEYDWDEEIEKSIKLFKKKL